METTRLDLPERRDSPATVEDGYCPAFDYLRIVLATSVAASHADLLTWRHGGDLPVQIFFALSGWLIGGILLRSKPKDLARFYFNRAARIWIPYFVALALLISVSLLKDTITSKWLEFVFYKITFVYNLFGPPQLELFRDAMPLRGTGNHFWSICSEEQFYLIAPILIVFFPAGRKPWFWAMTFAGLMLTPYWDYFAAISAGVLATSVRNVVGDWHINPPIRAALLLVTAILFGAVCFDIGSYALLSSILSISLVLLLAKPGAHSTMAKFLGGISYPMYLNHWIGVFAAHSIFGIFGLRDSFASHVFAVLFAIVFASILYLLIDEKIRRGRAKCFTSRRGVIAAGMGYSLFLLGLLVALYYHTVDKMPTTHQSINEAKVEHLC